MKIKFILFLLSIILCNQNYAQERLICKDGTATFFSKAPLEDIEAENDQAVSIIDPSTGKVAVKMLIKQFQFEKSLMQEHFNENYMESDQFPKATFTGSIVNLADINLKKDGTYTANVEGEIEIHGVKKPLATTVEFLIGNGKISTNTKFKVMTADFDIKIPKIVVKNIAEEIEITLAFEFDSLNS